MTEKRMTYGNLIFLIGFEEKGACTPPVPYPVKPQEDKADIVSLFDTSTSKKEYPI